ncbi:MAG: YfhO family protein, partial [Oscillospiraceae bacterium]
SIMIDKLLEGNVQLEGNSDNYRVDVYDGVDNTGMYLGLPTINAFHSIVPGSVTDFYKYIGEERGVASRPKTDFYAIRPLLSVKYVLNREGSKSFKGDDGKFLMPGYMEKDMQNGYHIYENENYIPYGFTYDYYMTQEQANEYGKENISKMMLKAILLDESQINRHNDILKDISLNYNIGGGYDINRESVAFDDETFAMDCARRATNTAYSFQRDNGGFTAAIDLPKDNLVFFSVPFENGWTAYIDNKKVDIEKVNVGFMAVRAPMGHSVIRFEYRTPGLMQGLLVTAGASIALLVYILVCFILKSKKPGLFATQYPEGEFLSLKFAQYYKDDLLIDKNGEEEPEEPSENFNPDEAYFGFEGGFKVDDSFLKNPEEQMKLSDFSKKKDNEEN